MELNIQLFILIGVTIASLLVIILVPMSFSDVAYDQYAFLKTKTTGTVDTSKVYGSGRYFTGPDKTFKTFSSVAHIEMFPNLWVFSADKLEININVYLQYFLRKDDLKLLHDAYDIHYQPTMRSTVQAAIKNRAATFLIDEYLKNRTYVETSLHTASQLALGGKCCSPTCTPMTCPVGCTSYSTCKKSEKGLFADVKYLQLDKVVLAPSIATRKLQAVITTAKVETETFKQDEKVQKKKTEQLSKVIQNQATEVLHNGTATADLLKAKAKTNSRAVTQDARNSGLQILYQVLGVTNQTHKSSLDYIKTLIDHANVNLYCNFKTMIAKP